MKKREKSQQLHRSTQYSQTDINMQNYLSEKELDLLVDLKHLERKYKKIEKEKLYNSNKISKFIYFFFTL